MANSSEEPNRAHNPSEFQFQLFHSHSQSLTTETNQNQNRSLSYGKRIFPTYLGNPFLTFSSHDHTNINLSHSGFINSSLKQEKERENAEVQTSGRAGKVVCHPSLESEYCKVGMHDSRKAKAKKNAKSGPQKLDAESPSAAGNCRYDSSLGLLTKKFVNLIMEAKDCTLDLNHTAKVLEAEIQSLYAEECRLDDCIREKQESLRFLDEDADYQKYMFLTKEDIMSLPCLQNQTVFAIKAPENTYIEVPDPDEDIGFPLRQYKMIIRSHNGPIDLYLVSKYEGQVEDRNVNQAKSVDASCSYGGVQRPELASEDKASQKNSSKTDDLLCPEAYGIQKIIPTVSDIDDDYWFLSDPGVSNTDLWNT